METVWDDVGDVLLFTIEALGKRGRWSRLEFVVSNVGTVSFHLWMCPWVSGQ